MSAVLTMQQRGWEAYAGKLGVDVMQRTQKCLDWICSQVKGKYVLDADCGQAAIPMLLAREGKTVVGLCSRTATMTQASLFIGEEPAQVQRNITLLTGSLQGAHTLVDPNFETVLLPQSVVQEEYSGDNIEIAFRMLKPGGRLISLWPFSASYYLREPMKLLTRHFETLEVRSFGDVLVIVSNARSQVLEHLPTANLQTALSQVQELQQKLEEGNEQWAELIQLQAKHEIQPATPKAELDSIQHAAHDAASTAQKVFGERINELQRSLVAKQHEPAEGELDLVEPVATMSQPENVILKLNEDVAALNHVREMPAAESRLDDPPIPDLETTAQQTPSSLVHEYKHGKHHGNMLQASIAESTIESQSMAQAQAELQSDNKSMKPSLKTLNAQLLEAGTSQRHAQAANVQQIQQLQKQLTDARKRADTTAAQLRDARMKGREFVAQYRGSQAQEKKAAEKIRHLERRIRNLEQQKAQALLQVEQTRKTLSFQLGYALLHAFRSWSSFFGLPAELIRIHKDGKERRQRKRMKQAHSSSVSVSTVAASRTKPKAAAQVSATTSTTLASPLLHKQKLKVAGIMDEFTFHSYAPECELLQLRPENYCAQVDNFEPDLVFIESAWKGIDDSWKGIISNCTDEITGLLNHCRTKGIPSIFWNKEDPVHFSTFIAVAGLVDHVFTTDVDCLPKYKAALGHDRVSLLPFAAQPKTHNPIEKFDRKDAFNFAGSYYLRYPERQRDFAALIDTVSSLKPVEIYDRNYDKPHPHYEFPDKYASMILGSLPFSEIDKAYKGYRYGVNMNTIKQSQTMYARRVFELLASNTVVVSNFSRGVRVMFGDLVVCSDDANQIRAQLEPICADELTYRKFRLQGLRKVMSQHTYRQRIQYIKSKLTNQPVQEQLRSVLVVAYANNVAERDRIIDSFSKQRHAAKALYVTAPRNTETDHDLPGVRFFSTAGDMISVAENTLQSFDLIGGMTSQAHYGEHYLTDLALAHEYSDAVAYTKAAHYVFDGMGNLVLKNDGAQYRLSTTAVVSRSLFRTASLTSTQFQAICVENTATLSIEALAIDEFNYCDLAGSTSISAQAQERCCDLAIQDIGASFHGDLIPIAEKIKKISSGTRDSKNALPKLTAEELYAALSTPKSKQIKVSLARGKLCIRSTMPPEKFAYIYAEKTYNRDELNLVLNSHFEVVTSDTQEIRSVFEFQDQAGKKIGHQMNAIGGAQTLAIPPNCVKIRFGFRIQGSGSGDIEALVLGSNGEPPSALLSRSPYLVLTKQYPAYDDLYRYGFLHSRVRTYKEAGLEVDVFRLTNLQEPPYREFEGINIASGDLELLDQTLATGQYKKVLVHLLDEKMWSVLQKHLDNVQVNIWIHGAEIQIWQRRAFEFERLSTDEVIRQKKLSDKRIKFWRSILAQPRPHKNVHLIFVSQYFADEVFTDLGIKIPQESYSIIHNYIDPKIFKYQEKPAHLRKKLLSIRPYASRKYANDLTVACILELSKRPFFKDLEFTLYGDGDLFESTLFPIREFRNVKLHQKFLSQQEISAIHKEHGVFLSPTRMDAQGVSRDEAMSSGLVPITNSVAAIPEFVDHECGYATAPEDAIAMADAIQEMYDQPAIFLRKSANASARTLTQCGFNSTIAREIALINY